MDISAGNAERYPPVTHSSLTYTYRRKIGTLTTKISADLYNDVNKLWQEATKKVPEGAALHYTIQPLTTSAVQAGRDRGGNMLGLEKVPQNCKSSPTHKPPP